jgi:hypothetical protein
MPEPSSTFVPRKGRDPWVVPGVLEGMKILRVETVGSRGLLMIGGIG